MCGIHFILEHQRNTDLAIQKMTDSTSFRGPDESHFQSFGDIGLGANRLKITDQTPWAQQPFISPDRKHALVFNGEIYNYYDLKNELLRHQVQFRSGSDTEVLFNWLKQFGAAGIDRLKGMFAFVFVDLHLDKVIFARDRFGIKPLYFYHDQQKTIVASEIRSILASGKISKRLNTNQIAHYLLFKHAQSPDTFFENVKEVRPGHCVTYQNGIMITKQYYQPATEKRTSAPDNTKVENLLTKSVLQQINVPVSTGILLSGGVDSTLLLALANKEGFSMPAFSIVNNRADRSFGTMDYHFARQAAKKFHAVHNEIEVDIGILKDFEALVGNMDQPMGDSAYLMTQIICKYASKSMKVLISGAGADEYFAGYNRHRAFQRYLQNKNTWKFIFPYIRPLLQRVPVGKTIPGRKYLRLGKKLANSISSSASDTWYNFVTLNNYGLANNIQALASQKFDLDKALAYDRQHFLIEDVLAVSDRASMQSGVELRVPYLDDDLTDYIGAFSGDMLLKHGQKWILKEILKKYGGEAFANRPKEGFGLPLAGWLVRSETDHLWKEIFDRKSILHEFIPAELLHHILVEQKSGKEDHGPFLWSVLVLAHWLQQHFG